MKSGTMPDQGRADASCISAYAGRRKLHGVGDRSGWVPLAGAIHINPAYARSGPDQSTAAATPADYRQAGYFLRLLTERCRLIDDRLAKHRSEIAIARSRGDFGYVNCCRRVMRSDERDRWELLGMIDRLQQRFARCAPEAVWPNPAPARLATR